MRPSSAFFEQALTTLFDGLNYANISKKGYVHITFSTSRAESEWRYVESIATQTQTTTVGHSERFSL